MLPPAGPVAVLRSAYRVPVPCWMLQSWSRPKFGQLGGQIGTLRQVAERLNAAFIPWRIQKDVAEPFGKARPVVARCDNSTIVPVRISDELPASKFWTPDRQLATNCRGQEYPRTRFRVCIGAPGGSFCRRPGSPALIFIPGAAEARAPAAAVMLQVRRACGLALIVQGGQISPPVGIQAGDRRQLVAARRLYSIADVCSCGTTWQHSFSPARSLHIVTAPETALFLVFCVRHKTTRIFSKRLTARRKRATARTCKYYGNKVLPNCKNKSRPADRMIFAGAAFAIVGMGQSSFLRSRTSKIRSSMLPPLEKAVFPIW